MKKIKQSYLSSLLRKSIQNGVDYVSEGHYIKYDFNTLYLKPFDNSIANHFQLDPILNELLALLKIRREKHFIKLALHFQEGLEIKKHLLYLLGLAIAQYFGNIKQLSLIFSRCDVADEDLEKLLDPISKKLKSLREINLHFNCCAKISDKGLAYIRQFILMRLKNIKHCSLVCSRNKTVVIGYRYLYFEPNIQKRLKYLSPVVEWSGGYSGNQTKVKQPVCISQRISRYLTNLQHLTLVLPFTTLYLNKAKENILFKLCQNLKKLKVLNFSFSEFNSVTDEVVNEITVAIGLNLINLEDLTLDFKYCENITDESLKVIDQNILLLRPNLHRLALSFNGCSGIEVKGL